MFSRLKTGAALAAMTAAMLLASGARPEPAGEWLVASPASVGADPAPLARLAEGYERGEFPKTTSVLVIYQGKLIFERYFGDGGVDVLNNTRSATKSITALAVGQAIGEHAIASVDAPAFSYLADMAPFANDSALKQAITVEDLLTMSSALACDDNVDASTGNEDRMHEQTDWTRWAVDLPTTPNYRRDAAGRGPFAYCTTGAVLLGQIVQRATRTPVDRFVESRLFAPLGISKWEWSHSPKGEVMTGGGLLLRSRDLAKLAWMLVDDGRWNGRPIVSPDWIRAAMTAHRQANPQQGYGYLFWQRVYATPCGARTGWYMAGNGGNAIVVLKELDAAVVVTRENYNTHGMHQQTVDLLERYVLPALPCRAAGHAKG
jgi:CubicO group peptidase (beta-lactamase class C family)